jgi:hypothetical protein
VVDGRLLGRLSTRGGVVGVYQVDW